MSSQYRLYQGIGVGGRVRVKVWKRNSHAIGEIIHQAIQIVGVP